MAQAIVEKSQAHAKNAPVRTVSTVNEFVVIGLQGCHAEVDDPEISQASSNRPFIKTVR
jgi:hypothetical protein